MSTVKEKEISETHTERELTYDYSRAQSNTSRNEFNFNYDKISQTYDKNGQELKSLKVRAHFLWFRSKN